MHLSSYEGLDLICSALGICISILGFYFIWKQVIQVNSTIKSSANNYLYSLTIDINKFLIANPALRPYFYGNADGSVLDYDSNDPHFQQIETLADIYVTFWEYIFEERKHLGKELFDSWEEWKKEVYQKSIAIQNHINNNRKWYKDDFIKSFSN